ncbi:hypothetical protein RHOFW510R12_12700 [Rhodanobacter sp. FW510-R12]|uniref:DUF6933 domain-containing protein n=1 Tax=unclassified Rhodanobacter TaxID=2621553 RepID=UPI0007AA1336|nr:MULTISPECIES: hypothetical protein [unclassified Rhodanobacter]KZC17225.1 hypothetical protein RHOFW104R8_12245 [Rhodanobacter sp. FW104-R8]KZC29081.1 hypothetical protein RhoFW510T8_07955 [Rhodanobacter sp. FW510-T8]KZC33019.1 hypothetical protein RhoFW510R10_09810 [Rhodanobacter sp. FW510-R10]
MTVVRCSQKLLKRLRVPPALAEPAPSDNPLGEWCADIDFIDRQPFVLLMNAATGTVLVVPGRAVDLKRLYEMAAEQLRFLLAACGIGGALAEGELDAWRSPPAFARNGNRSLVSSMNQRKYEAWSQFAHGRLTAFEVALRMLETPFSRKDLGRDFHFAADLLRARLMPSAKIIPLHPTRDLH